MTLTAPGDCPKCEAGGFENPGALAAHLIDAHDMAGIAALALARQTAGELRAGIPATRIPTKETPMAKNEDRTGECSECHRLRHVKECSRHFLRRKPATAPPAATKRKAITRRHPLPPKKAAGATSNGLVSELEALTAVVEALTGIDSFDSKRNVLLCACRLLQIDPTKLAA